MRRLMCHQLSTSSGRRSVNQTAFKPSVSGHKLALAAKQCVIRVGTGSRQHGQRHGLEGVTGISRAKVIAPWPLNIEAAVAGNQGRNPDTPALQQGNPCAIGTQPSPAPTSQGQHNSIESEVPGPLWCVKHPIAPIPADPPVSGMKPHGPSPVRSLQPVQPGAQERRRLHSHGKHPLG